MRLFRFSKDVGRPMERYHSSFIVYSQIAKISTPSSIGCMYIDPEGMIGFHEAPAAQLFFVVQGEGWVRGRAEDRIQVKTGEGVYWEKGEWHESGSETGMMGIIIQFDAFDPGPLNLLDGFI